MADVINIGNGRVWFAACPKCECETFYIIVESMSNGSMKKIVCANEYCDFYSDIDGPNLAPLKENGS